MTGVFRGRHSLRLDPKGRLVLPTLIRAAQGPKAKLPNFFITNALYRGQKHLDVFFEKDWLVFEKKIGKMPQLDADVQAFRRFYLAGAVPVQSDAQGRLLIPAELRDYANLTDDVVILGVGGKFEIWPAQRWSLVQAEITQTYDDVLRAVAKLEGSE